MKRKNNYIFPNILAAGMKNVSQRVQYEGALLSTSLLVVGILAFGVYLVIFMEVGTFFKILVSLNTVAGVLLMSSSLVTTYQQYVSYLEAIEMFDPTSTELSKKEQEEIKNDI